MAVTAYKSAGTQSSEDRSGGVTWGSPANAAASDNSRSTASLAFGPSVNSDWLRLTNFGFSSSDIPSGATIDGIEYQIERSVGSGSGTVTDLEIFLRITSGQVGSSGADTGTSWPAAASEAYATYGGATSKFGRTWTQSEIVSTDFGLDISARLSAGASRVGQIDHAQVRVHYTDSATGTIAASLQAALFSGSAAQTQTGTIAGTLRAATMSASGAQTYSGSIAATLQATTFTGVGASPSLMLAHLAPATASLTGVMAPKGTVAAELSRILFSATGSQPFQGTIAATTQKATFTGAAGQQYLSAMAARLQVATAALVGTVTGVSFSIGSVAVAIAKKFLVKVGILKKFEVAVQIARKHEVEIAMSTETCYVGNSIISTGTFTNVSTGLVADPSAITVKVKNAASTVTSYVYGTDSNMAKTSTGIYTCTFTPSSDGTWTVEWIGTGNAVAVNMDTFKVLPAF